MSAKPFHIPKQQVMQAYRLVKANAGAAGIDQQSLADFEGDLKNNLYRLWNQLSSGSYFPPAVGIAVSGTVAERADTDAQWRGDGT